MDSLRGFLMLLGVVYHGALIFEPGISWRVETPHKHFLLGQLTWFIHLFRMPTFFLIAGSFSALLIKRYGERGFLRNRLERIALPLLATAVLVNPVINLLSATRSPLDIVHYFLRTQYFSDGEWILHLWFLNVLLIFSVLCLVGIMLTKVLGLRRVGVMSKLDFAMRQPRPIPELMLMVLLPACSALTMRVGGHFLFSKPLLLGMIDSVSLCNYFPYFLFGYVIWKSEPLNDRFVNIWFWLPALALALFLSYVTSNIGRTDTARYVEYAGYLGTWGMASFCLWVCRQYCSRPFRVFRYLSDASYTIYLVHLLFMVLLGPLVVTSNLSVYAKFGLIVTSATAMSLAFHHFLVLRVSVLRLLFNGKRKSTHNTHN